MSKNSLGGYVGSSTRPAWVGVLDPSSVVADPVVAEVVEAKSVERKARIKAKSKPKASSSSSVKSPAPVKHPVIIDDIDDDENSIDSDNVGADILLAEDSYASDTSEGTPAPLSAMSDKSAFSQGKASSSSSRRRSPTKKSPTSRSKTTSAVNSALKKKVVEVEKLVERVMALKEKDLKAEQKSKASAAVRRKDSTPKRTKVRSCLSRNPS